MRFVDRRGLEVSETCGQPLMGHFTKVVKRSGTDGIGMIASTPAPKAMLGNIGMAAVEWCVRTDGEQRTSKRLLLRALFRRPLWTTDVDEATRTNRDVQIKLERNSESKQRPRDF